MYWPVRANRINEHLFLETCSLSNPAPGIHKCIGFSAVNFGVIAFIIITRLQQKQDKQVINLKGSDLQPDFIKYIMDPVSKCNQPPDLS